MAKNEKQDVKVADLRSALKVMRLLSDNAKSNQAYFKKSAVDEIVEYLEKRIKDCREKFNRGELE